MDDVELYYQLKALRLKAEQQRKLAEKEGDSAKLAAIQDLIGRMDLGLDMLALGAVKGLASDLVEIEAELLELMEKAKAWPFGQDDRGHEQQFRAELQENDADDQGPDSAPPPPQPVPPNVVPTVSQGWTENYLELWNSMAIRPDWRDDVQAVGSAIVANQSTYASAVDGTSVPWWFIAVVHAMESGLNFTKHIHNGDSLKARTVQVPAGRPPKGSPPFTWKASARDFLSYKKLDLVTDWSLPTALFHWHRNNGINNEYKRRHIPTPYLWSGSQHYLKGKYVKDHVFDPEAVSKQPGAAVILRALIDLKAVTLGSGTVLKANPVASVGSVAALSLKVTDEPTHIAKELAYPGDLRPGSKKAAGVKRLQEWLSFHGFATPVDADFGPSTAAQLRKFASANSRSPSDELSEELWALLTGPMRKALAPLTNGEDTMERAVVRLARQHVAQAPTEIGGANLGPWVRLYMEGQEGAAEGWSSGFSCFVVDQAARGLRQSSPFERRDRVTDLVSDARNRGRFISESDVANPVERRSRVQPGCIFVVRQNGGAWTSAGIVARLNDETFDTFEGDTNTDGSVAGPNATEGNRNYINKDFIRLF